MSDRIKNDTRTFIYADPPYFDTDCNTYKSGWSEKDTEDLFKMLTEYATNNYDANGNNIKFAISEFDNPIILELANKYNLQVTIIGERQNLLNRRTEILITNYDTKTINKKNELF